MSPQEKARRTRKRKRAARLAEVEAEMQEASDAYATATLHGDHDSISDVFARLRRLGRERHSLRWSQ